ncbi:MAG: nickel pincer cofactor biosynthesis protein LarB [Planctomycetes bacterium]|nr:nickel pincer cofactor biosynthesis protein LarB [Planctomycetota bacterium]
MNERTLRNLLLDFKRGRLETDELLRRLRALPYSDLGFAKVDHHRALRCGFPEVIFCHGKTPRQIREIARRILAHDPVLLATRASLEAYEAIRETAPNATYHESARCVTVGARPAKSGPYAVIVAAGTSDIPVADEARVATEAWGARVETLYDVGVAGLHRLLAHLDLLMGAAALVVVAGMEGALPSVVGGLVRRPVIAVPTSVGYGAHFKGLTALLSMLNSCAAGVSVVNIDNGFGAGYLAGMILSSPSTQRASRSKDARRK